MGNVRLVNHSSFKPKTMLVRGTRVDDYTKEDAEERFNKMHCVL